jgi:hypothetical protein
MSHAADIDLALYASGDLALWRRALAALHVRACEECRARLAAFREDRERLRESAGDLPDGVHWERLSAEMTANIRVGLAAGECVAPRVRKTPAALPWKPAAVAAGVAALVMGAWWLNMPASDTQALSRVWQGLRHGGRLAMPAADLSTVVEASSEGVELRENGSALGIEQAGSRPVTFSVSAQGSASARYVDDDTGQVTITSVMYVQ